MTSPSISTTLTPILENLHTGIVDIATFLPLITEIISALNDLSHFQTLTNDERKHLMVSCINILISQLPLPDKVLFENLTMTIAIPMFDSYIAWNETHPKPTAVSTETTAESKLGRKYCLRRQEPDTRDLKFKSKLPLHELPSSHDLRDTKLLPPVYDQGSLGSCTANACCAALSYLLHKEGIESKFVPSRLFVYYMTRVGIENTLASDDSGCMLRDVCKAISKFHVCHERYFPYDVTTFADRPSAMAVANAHLHNVVTYEACPQDEYSIKSAIASGFPVFIGIQIYTSFESQEVMKTGIVPMPTPHDRLLGGHALICCSYNDQTRMFTIMNSWGTEVGDKGFFYIPYDYILDPKLACDFWTFTYFK